MTRKFLDGELLALRIRFAVWWMGLNWGLCCLLVGSGSANAQNSLQPIRATSEVRHSSAFAVGRLGRDEAVHLASGLAGEGGLGEVGLRYDRIDAEQLAGVNARELLAAVTFELLQIDSAIEDQEEKRREATLRRVQKFAEQAVHYEQQGARHMEEHQALEAVVSGSGSSGTQVAEWEERLAIAQQRWPLIRERLALVEDRRRESERDEEILRDFIEDNETLDRYLLVCAERLSRQAELRMLQAEMVLAEFLLDEAPRVIKKLKKLASIQSSNGKTTKSSLPLDLGDSNREEPLPVAEGSDSKSDTTGNRPYINFSAQEQLLKIKARVQEVLEETSAVGQQLESIENKTQSLRDKYERFGLVEGNQLLFLEAHRRLPSEDEIRIRNHETRQELRDLNVALLAAEKGLAVERERGGSGNREVDAAAIQVSEEGYQELLVQIEGLYQRLIELTSERERLILAVEEQRYFLDHKLLWVRNSEPLGVAVFVRSSEGLWSLVQPAAWIDLLRGLWGHLLENPLQLTGWMLGLFFLRWVSGRVSAGRLIQGVGA